MKVIAKTSFSGSVISMHEGEVRDVPEGDVLDDLIRCKYVEPVESEEPAESEESMEAEKNENINVKSAKRKAVSEN